MSSNRNSLITKMGVDMHKRLAASVLVVAALFPIAPRAFSQSILEQDRDELLKGFDVDPSTLSQYQPKPTARGRALQFLKLLGSALPSVSVQTSGGEPNIQVKAPFVNVKVGSIQTGIRVTAPFVNIDAGSPEQVSPARSPQSADDPQAAPTPDAQSAEDPKAASAPDSQSFSTQPSKSPSR